MTSVLCAFGGLVLGLAGAFLNTFISKRNMNSENFGMIMATNMLRLLVDIAVLTLTFFVCRSFELPLAACLISAAAGLSIGGLLMLRSATKKLKDSIDNKDGGE